MRFPGFIGPSYTLQSVNADCQRCVNLYPEVNETGTGKEKEVAALVGTPGLSLLATIGSGPIRGVYTASDGVLYVASGAELYSVDSSWAGTLLGALNSILGPVSFADNGIHVVLVDGTDGYAYTIASASFAEITDADFLGADQVAYLDGYFVFNSPDSGQFYISDLNSVDFDALDIASAEGSPDDIVGLIVEARSLYLVGQQSTEIFYNSGNADFPIERIQGGTIPIGTNAPFSIARLQGAVYFLGQDENGRGIVYRIDGQQPQRVSTHAIENVFRGLGDLSTARAYTYQQGGHSFYCLNLPLAETTWCFDTSTNLWHERAAMELGELVRHRADCHAFAYETNVVGDFEDGKIYALDPDTYTDNTAELPRIRTAPHVSTGLARAFHSRFQLDMETGVGLDGDTQGDDPQAMLDWSDDGGHSWSNEHWTGIGAIGSRLTRAIWRRLGCSRDRVYRVRITDPVKVTMLGADLTLEQGAA